MKIKLIALAVAGAFVTPLAMANGVTLYGQMGVSIDSVKGDNAVGSTVGGERRTRVSSNNSRIGFKGTEDINSDLSAIWQIEYAVQVDQQGYSQPQTASDSQGGVSLRNTFVGLSSKRMGALTLGTQEAPLKTSTQPLAVFNDTLADYRSVFTKLSTRSDNSILYTSPSLGGLVIRAMYGERNEAGNDSLTDPRMWGASLVYSGGPFYATLAYEDNRNVTQSVTAANGTFRCTATGVLFTAASQTAANALCAPNTVVTAPVTASAGGVSSTVKAWRAGIGYTLMGNTKFGLAYENNDAETATGANANDGHAWYASVSHRIGNITLAAAYTDRSDTGNGLDDGAKQYTGGVEYAFSKRTSIYGLYTKVKNDAAGTNNIGAATGIATVSTVAGGDPSGFSLGMRHSF